MLVLRVMVLLRISWRQAWRPEAAATGVAIEVERNQVWCVGSMRVMREAWFRDDLGGSLADLFGRLRWFFFSFEFRSATQLQWPYRCFKQTCEKERKKHSGNRGCCRKGEMSRWSSSLWKFTSPQNKLLASCHLISISPFSLQSVCAVGTTPDLTTIGR